MSSPPEAASPPHEFLSVWGRAEVLTPHLLQSGTFSSTPHGDVITVLFDQATPEPNLINSPPESPPRAPRMIGSPPHVIPSPPHAPHAAWCGMLRIPLALPAGTRAVWFKSDLRVFVAKDVGARVLLLADLAGQSFVREFPYETASGVEAQDGGGVHTFQIVHQAQITPAEGYTFSMLILVERLTLDKLATVFLDSLDITVNPDLKASASPNPETTSPPDSPPSSPPDSPPNSLPDSPPDSPPAGSTDSPPSSPPASPPGSPSGSPPDSPPNSPPRRLVGRFANIRRPE